MRDLLYLKDDQIKDFIEQIFYAYRETYSDPKQILKKYSFGNAHHRAIHLIERHEGLTVSELLNKKDKNLFEEIFLEQKKRIYNALKNSDSDSVLKF